MSKLKVPSLQHLARIWRPEPDAIRRILVRLTKNGPTFSYAPLFDIVHGMLVFKTPYDQSLEAVNRIKREDVRTNFLGLLPLVRDHFASVNAEFVHDVVPRLYPISRELVVPFKPTLIYGADGEIHFPWLSFWMSNPLVGDSLALFVTIVEEVLLADSDLDSAQFSILDFSVPAREKERALGVISACDIPRVSAAQKKEMLSIFAEGFRLAKAEVASESRNLEDQPPVVDSDDNQLPLL